MFRKKPFETVLPMGEPWTEPQIKSEESKRGTMKVSRVDVKCSDICEQQLDPSIITLQSLIDRGITIDPGSVRSMLNITDEADLQRYDTEYTKGVYQYLVDHPDVFKSKESVEPVKSE